MGNVDFALSLVEELEMTLDSRVGDICDSADREDLAGTAEAAHTLKGAAGILYAYSIKELAAEIESAARSSETERLADKVRDLKTEMRKCLDFLPSLRTDLVASKEI